jgi:hypothetical protein
MSTVYKHLFSLFFVQFIFNILSFHWMQWIFLCYGIEFVVDMTKIICFIIGIPWVYICVYCLLDELKVEKLKFVINYTLFLVLDIVLFAFQVKNIYSIHYILFFLSELTFVLIYIRVPETMSSVDADLDEVPIYLYNRIPKLEPCHLFVIFLYQFIGNIVSFHWMQWIFLYFNVDTIADMFKIGFYFQIFFVHVISGKGKTVQRFKFITSYVLFLVLDIVLFVSQVKDIYFIHYLSFISVEITFAISYIVFYKDNTILGAP